MTKSIYDSFDYVDGQVVPKSGAAMPTSAGSADAGSAQPSGGAATDDPIVAIQEVAKERGINPEYLLGLAKLETRTGEASVKGDGRNSNNLFNIKDFYSNSGIRANDKAEGSRDRYRSYSSYRESVEDLVNLLERRYPGATRAQSADEFARSLKLGGYATDPNYIDKLTGTIRSVSENGGTRPAEPKNWMSKVSDDAILEASGFGASQTMYRQPPPAPKSLKQNVGDLAGSVWSGVKDLGRSAMATADTVTGNLSDVELLAQAQKVDEASKPEEYRALIQEIAKRKEANPDAPWWQAVGDVGDAAWKNKLGTAQMIASQAPNSAAILGGAWAGGKTGAAVGSVFGPVGTVTGGVLGAISGMFLGNYLVETGSKAMEKAADGYTPQEARDALTEGAKKAAVVTGVDMATLGLGTLAGKTILGGAARAGAKAEAKVLAEAGVDIASREAVVKALATNPELFTAAKEAGELAAKQATTMGVRAARSGGGLAMESAGEGIGEYYGEVAATGKGDIYDAALEALSSFPQSAAETAWTIRHTDSNKLDPGGIIRAAAEKEGSPLSRAAVKGIDSGAAGEAALANEPPAQTPPTGPAAPQVDPITARVEQVEQLTRESGLLGKLRELNIEGMGADDFLSALATARNTKLDQQTPLLREQALEKIEKALQVLQAPGAIQAGRQWQAMGTAPTQGSLEQQKAEQDAALQTAQQAGQAWQGLGVSSPQEDLQAQRTAQKAQDVAAVGDNWQAMQAGMQPVGETSFNTPMSGPVGETSNVQDAPPKAPSYTMVPAPSVKAEQGGQGTAQVRKRKAELGALVSQGFDTVAQDATGADVLLNQKTGEAHALTFSFDKKLARDLIHGLVRAAADQSPNSPNNSLPESTPAQNKAGNYLKPPVSLNGYSIRVENPKGSERRGTDPDGKDWSVTMGSDYGYINGTRAADGDGVDVYVGDNPEAAGIFVIDQVNKDGSFDEPKVVMGVADEAQARQTYLSNYEPGWTGLGAITPMSREQFDAWLKNGGPLGPTALDSQASTGSVYSVDQTTGEVNGREGNRAAQDAAGGVATDTAQSQNRPAGGAALAPVQPGGEYDAADADVRQSASNEDTAGSGAKAGPGEQAADAAGTGLNGEYGEAELRLIADLQTRLRADGADISISPAQPDDARLIALQPLLDVFERQFGQRPIAVVATGENAWDGISWEGQYFINLDSARMPVGATIAHEFKHVNEDKPALNLLYRRLWSLIPNEAKAAYLPFLQRTHQIRQGVTLDQLNAEELKLLKDEMLADFMGQRFTDKAWLNNLAKQKPALFGEFVRDWIKLLGELIAEFRKAIGANSERNIDALMRQHLAQLEEMKAVAMDVAEAWAQERPALAKQSGLTLDSAPRLSAKPETVQAYRQRIDELFSGAQPNAQGVRILERSDMLAMLGLGDGPVHLVEGKVRDSKVNHPHMTAAAWKNVPAWLENPAAVFDSETQPGRLVFVAPELVNGSPVRMIVDPRPSGQGVNLLINAYDAQVNPFARWAKEGLLRYLDRQKATPVLGSFQSQLAGLSGERGRNGILTEKNLAGYRRTQQVPESDVPKLTPIKQESAQEAAPAKVKHELERDANGKIILKHSPRQSARERSMAPGVYGKARPGAVSVTGYHFSNSPRQTLISAFYGTGVKGAERERLDRPDARDIRPRIHFYVDTGKGVRPETGVGGYPHKLEMRNLYDASQDPLGLVRDAQPQGDEPKANAWERAILKAGFDGYVVRDKLQPQGQAVLLGKHAVQVVAGQRKASDKPDLLAPVPSVTRRIGDRLVRRVATGEFIQINAAKPILVDMAPSFKVEFGEASALEREAPTVNAILQEQGASFRLSTQDFLPEDISQRLIIDLKSDGYKALNSDVVVVVPMADGKEARLTVNAQEAMTQLDRRQDALEHVKECLL